MVKTDCRIRNKTARFIALAAALLLLSCADKEAKPSGWFYEPDAIEELCAVGGGSSERIATLNAKANLARQIETQTQSEARLRQNESETTFESVSLHTAQSLIKEASVTNIETVDSVVYIRLCVDRAKQGKLQ